jgi:alkanesulfonate monooxygenase SsuD/methylene tetrahydromethanopterin reductase-like flavin-dependent oxidoreductase (luciferase family)
MSSELAPDTSNRPKLGFYIPSYVAAFGHEQARSNPARRLRSLAQVGRDQGMTSAWTVDHLLHSDKLYSTTWYEPLTSLAAISGIDGLEVGTGVLIAPLRQPQQTAKIIHSLAWLNGTPVRLGVGAGWSDAEYELVGIPKSSRGKILDENLQVIVELYDYLLREERELQHALTGTDAETADLEVWIAGGSQFDDPASPDKANMADGVLKRIIKYGRWATRPTMTVEQAWSDLQLLMDSNEGKAPTRLHFNFLHLIDEDLTRDEILDRQHKAYRYVMSDHRSRAYMEACYLMGTIDDIREKVAGWAAFGITDLVLHPLVEYEQQFELWNKHLGDLVALR